MITKSTLKRFALHIAFGALATAATAVVADVASLHLNPAIVPLVTMAGTAAASFFGRESVANG